MLEIRWRGMKVRDLIADRAQVLHFDVVFLISWWNCHGGMLFSGVNVFRTLPVDRCRLKQKVVDAHLIQPQGLLYDELLVITSWSLRARAHMSRLRHKACTSTVMPTLVFIIFLTYFCLVVFFYETGRRNSGGPN